MFKNHFEYFLKANPFKKESLTAKAYDYTDGELQKMIDAIVWRQY